MASGNIPIGVGGPVNPFDEHGRGDGKSAATMAAEHYGITEHPAVKPILAYSLKADDRATDHPFNEATLIKTMHAAGVDVEKIRAMHRRWFDSQCLYFGGRLVFADVPRLTLQQMAILWLKATYARKSTQMPVFSSFAEAMEAFEIPATDVDELCEIARYVDRDHAKHGSSPFELAGLVKVAQFTNAKDIDILSDVAVILDSKVKTQRDFLAAMAYFKEHASYIDGDERVALVRSDNDQMQKAARKFNERLIITVQKRSSGYLQIFSDQERDLRPILARLRAAELAKAGLRPLPRNELFEGGTNQRCEAWYGFEKYGKIIAIFCGSLKTRHHRKTKLTEQEIVQCVREALPHVHRSRGVRRDRSEHQPPSAPQA
jgi:hypothetical protein